jgi:hypothetical protein
MTEPGGSLEHVQGRLRQGIHVEEAAEESIGAVDDHVAHGLRIGGQDRTSAGHRVQEGPAEDERGREVDVQIAEAEHVDEFPARQPAEEPDAVQVVVVLAQDVLPQARPVDVLEVIAVYHVVGSDHHEDHVRTCVADPLGDAHEDVEPSHRLESSRDVGDDPRSVRGETPIERSTPDRGVDAVGDDAHLRPVPLREEPVLERRGGVPGIATLEVQEHRCVLDAVPEHGPLRRREVRTEIDRRTVRTVEVLEVVDHGRLREQLGEEQR